MTRQLTESVNPNSKDIDLKSIPEILTVINNEDMLVPLAVQKALPLLCDLWRRDGSGHPKARSGDPVGR